MFLFSLGSDNGKLISRFLLQGELVWDYLVSCRFVSPVFEQDLLIVRKVVLVFDMLPFSGNVQICIYIDSKETKIGSFCSSYFCQPFRFQTRKFKDIIRPFSPKLKDVAVINCHWLTAFFLGNQCLSLTLALLQKRHKCMSVVCFFVSNFTHRLFSDWLT